MKHWLITLSMVFRTLFCIYNSTLNFFKQDKQSLTHLELSCFLTQTWGQRDCSLIQEIKHNHYRSGSGKQQHPPVPIFWGLSSFIDSSPLVSLPSSNKICLSLWPLSHLICLLFPFTVSSHLCTISPGQHNFSTPFLGLPEVEVRWSVYYLSSRRQSALRRRDYVFLLSVPWRIACGAHIPVLTFRIQWTM